MCVFKSTFRFAAPRAHSQATYVCKYVAGKGKRNACMTAIMRQREVHRHVCKYASGQEKKTKMRDSYRLWKEQTEI